MHHAEVRSNTKHTRVMITYCTLLRFILYMKPHKGLLGRNT
jgi:hypothetical protein